MTYCHPTVLLSSSYYPTIAILLSYHRHPSFLLSLSYYPTVAILLSYYPTFTLMILFARKKRVLYVIDIVYKGDGYVTNASIAFKLVFNSELYILIYPTFLLHTCITILHFYCMQTYKTYLTLPFCILPTLPF